MADTVLVTGGAGFIGANLVRQWLADDDRLTLVTLDKLTYAGHRESLRDVLQHPRHRFVQGDIGDAALVAEMLKKHRPRAIVHLAAESHVDRSIDGPAAFVQTNVVGTWTLLDAALEYWRSLAGEQERFRYLHVSTDEVFGSLGSTGSFSEQSRYDPRSPYAATKAAADHLARAYFHTYGLPVLVTNCSNNFGPYQFPEKLIPLTIHAALTGKPLPVYGDGQQVRDWLFVGDHCRALRQVLRRGTPGETYNIGAHCERKNLELVQSLCAILDKLRPRRAGGYADLITFVPDRPGHDRRYAIDASKIERELGWQPAEEFETALERTVRWYLDNDAWCEAVTRGAYGGERLGRAR